MALDPRALLDELDPPAVASRAAPARPRVGQLLFEPRRQQVDARALLDELAPEEKPSVIESLARGGANAATLGFADEIAGGLESLFTDKSYKQARDESRASYQRAKEENPIAYGVGQVGGTVASMAIPGLGLAKGAGAAATIARAAAQGGAAALGDSTADLTEGDFGGALADTAGGALVGGAIGAAGVGVGKAVKGFMKAAPARADAQFLNDMSAGANSAFRKRFGQLQGLAREVLEPDTAFMKAARKGPAEGIAVATDRLDSLSAQTGPLWQKLDDTVGKVPVTEVRDFMLNAAKHLPPEAEVLDRLLVRKANHFADKYGNQLGQDEVSHKTVRQWVTGMLKQADETMGGLNAGERFMLKSELHETADDYLRARLQAAAQAAPQLSDDLAKLSAANREIAAYARAKNLLEHKAEMSTYKDTGFGGMIEKLATGGGKGVAAGAGAAMGALSGHGSLEGAAMGYAIPAGIQLAAKGAKAIDRKVTAAAARLVEAAARGDNVAKATQEAIEAGVPQKAVRGILGAYRAASGFLRPAIPINEQDGQSFGGEL